jgi:hypothetical protein
MAVENITIKLIAEPSAVTAGHVVKLRAETSLPAVELVEQCFAIDFEVLKLPKRAQPEKINFAEGLWRTTADTAQEVYHLVAKLLEPGPGRKEIARDQKDVTVIAAATIDLQTDPAAPVVVREGAQVKLTAQVKAVEGAVFEDEHLKALQLDVRFDTANVVS